MGSITYFFELYDDDGDGKVDREGILRISEALLFLSRRGLEGSLTPSISVNGLSEFEAGNGAIENLQSTTNERFLSSVSAFIRRCFEYADPDHPQNQGESTSNSTNDKATFGIGGDSDEEENLLDLGSSNAKPPTKSKKSTGLPLIPPPLNTTDLGNSSRRVSKAEAESANAALDPSKPLHITLPTFRMVVLADELLEQFFESSFPASFRISDKMAAAGASSSSSSLTTFSNLGFGGRSLASSTVGSLGGTSSAGLVPPSKGLRGVLDNIVTDGMRVAAEVRKRMDEAQKEFEKNAGHRPEEDEEDDEGYDGTRTQGADAERRSVRSEDRDLLEGADAEAGSARGQDGIGEGSKGTLGPVAAGSGSAVREHASNSTEKIVVFE
jgi:hypothetical protein